MEEIDFLLQEGQGQMPTFLRPPKNISLPVSIYFKAMQLPVHDWKTKTTMEYTLRETTHYLPNLAKLSATFAS